MKFAHIEMFVLLWGLPLLLLAFGYGWRRRKRILGRYADLRVLKPLLPPGLAIRRRMQAGMTLLAALLLVLAMAGPQYGFRWQTVERRGADLIIALDCSRSMLAEDTQPTRLDRAKREIVDLLGMLQGDRVGLVAFSGTAFLQCPLTLDYTALDLFLSVLNPDYLPVGGSDLSAAIQTSLEAFDPRDPAEKAIILITDGEHTGRRDPHPAALAARQAGVKLFCIGVGAAAGVPVPSAKGGFQKDSTGQIVLTRLDETLLTRLALATGGRYVRSVAGDADLEYIYRAEIRAAMSPAALEGDRRQVWADRFQWPLALALVLLLAAWALPETKKGSAVLGIFLVLACPAVRPVAAGPLQEGYAAYELEQYDRALDQFRKGQARRPDDPRLLYNIGNAYYKTGNFDAAQACYQRAMSQAPPELKARLHYNLGNTAYRRHALTEAIDHYRAALEIDPGDQQARDNLAFVRQQLEKQPQSSSAPQEDRMDSPSRESERSPEASRLQSPPLPPDPEGKPPVPQSGAAAGNHGQDIESTRGEEQMAPSDEARGAIQSNGQLPSPNTVQLLNRLKDEPGRALVPRYQPQTVEKDW